MAQNRDTLAPLDHVESGAVLDREAEDGTQWFRLVTPAIDQHGTIIRPEGVRTERFAANPVFLWMHQSGGGFSAPSPDVVIGRVVKWEQSDEAFDILVEFDTSQLATECLRKVRAKLIRMVSIGFRAIKRVDQEIDGRTVPVYEEVELLEASLVIIGSFFRGPGFNFTLPWIDGVFFDINGGRCSVPDYAMPATVKELGQPHRWKGWMLAMDDAKRVA